MHVSGCRPLCSRLSQGMTQDFVCYGMLQHAASHNHTTTTSFLTSIATPVAPRSGIAAAHGCLPRVASGPEVLGCALNI